MEIVFIILKLVFSVSKCINEWGGVELEELKFLIISDGIQLVHTSLAKLCS